MIEIREVKTKKEINQFIDFPINLYKGNPYFVPPLHIAEKDLFKKKNPYSSSCETIYFNAYEDNKIVGRISGIIQLDANKKWNTKNVRFTRFDAINNQDAANALFDAVINWAKEKGMDTIQGPLGFNDLEREGLLIDGFNQLATFEEQYNYPYYQNLIENYGFKKDVDWLEQKLTLPDNYDKVKESLTRFQNQILEKYHLHLGSERNISRFIDKYKKDFFTLLDDTYSHLYGTCPISDDVRKELISNFKLIMRTQYIHFILNEKEEMVSFGLCFPSIAEAVKKSDGKLTPSAIIRILNSINNPKVIDLGLIGVRDDYKNAGLPITVLLYLLNKLEDGKLEHLETNLTLENNTPILNLLSRFKGEIHKRRRSYSLKID